MGRDFGSGNVKEDLSEKRDLSMPERDKNIGRYHILSENHFSWLPLTVGAGVVYTLNQTLPEPSQESIDWPSGTLAI